MLNYGKHCSYIRMHYCRMKVAWMPPPAEVPPDCPPGLEYLTQIDQLLVQQQIELLEGT